MTYTILIVDDEPLARKLIREFLDKMDKDVLIMEAGDAISAQKILLEEDIDILFLDINMPLMTGLELAASNIGDALVIFTTAYAEHAVAAFEVAAFDYLVKPIGFSRFQKSCERAISHLKSGVGNDDNAWMMVKEGKRMYKVPYGEIRYLQAYGDYVKIFSDQKTYLMKTKLSALGDQLPPKFVKSHRSYIVSLDRINYVEGNHVVIDKEKVPISDGCREGLMNRL